MTNDDHPHDRPAKAFDIANRPRLSEIGMALRSVMPLLPPGCGDFDELLRRLHRADD